MEWTREQTVQLIDCYRGHILLWDPTHVLYKQRITDAWRETAEILKVKKDEAEKNEILIT